MEKVVTVTLERSRGRDSYYRRHLLPSTPLHGAFWIAIWGGVEEFNTGLSCAGLRRLFGIDEGFLCRSFLKSFGGQPIL